MTSEEWLEDKMNTEGERCQVSYMEWGCDWPERVADIILDLRMEVRSLREELEIVNRALGTAVKTLLDHGIEV